MLCLIVGPCWWDLTGCLYLLGLKCAGNTLVTDGLGRELNKESLVDSSLEQCRKGDSPEESCKGCILWIHNDLQISLFFTHSQFKQER